ncbi:glycosyltransferase [Candidatus Mycobacterium wuenschmannii]|uniref:Glycosyltransferase n=1 Tax=Candidatus Mycobacterium wuenschmannii TaxID=3027808 RepID=A0ABY8VZ69_9MYCO|nr:nucleotide disphospho-sugar-binding domain-containing protein [Candidatus Mycobacterium wuenschmannii]WIM88925.1 glycosyltransferase [Candidatus Mycobacterium wuenschmannii]
MKFVVAAYGSRGDIEPCIAVAGELQRRGHDVQMAVTVPADLRSHVEATGLSTQPYGQDWQELLATDDFTRMLRNPMSTIPQAVDYVARVNAEKTAALAALADGADLVVAGMTEQETAAKVAERYRIPVAALHFFPAQILPQGASWPDHEPDRALQIQAYDEICIPGLAAGWGDGADRRPFVGALTLQLPTDTDDDVASWISAGSPPVYFGFGSMPVAGPAEMVAVIGAACARTDVRALICLGPNYFDESPDSAQVKTIRDANHAAVFPACRAVVHHGGAGTTAAGMRAGAPSLVLWSGLDQPVWATSVAHLGVGFGRRFSESTLDTLTADLQAILSRSYSEQARSGAPQMTSPAESLTRAADLLEEAATRGSQD